MNKIDYVYRKALNSIDVNQSEPYIVANMIYKIVDATNSTKTRKNLKKIISASGIFVHSSPFVKYNKIETIGRKTTPKSVEIGDLLLLRTAKRPDGTYSRHALLLQAKKVKNINFYPLVPDNAKQHYLYANWPKFEYTNSSNLNGEQRHIRGWHLYHAAQYLIVDSSKKFVTYMPNIPKIRYYKNFVRQLTDFILGHEGKPFEYGKLNKNWDHVITDLMDETAKRTRKEMKSRAKGNVRTRKGIKAGLRGYGMMYFASDVNSKILLNHFSDDEMIKLNNMALDSNDIIDIPPTFDSEKHEKESEGISIIEFFIDESEENE